MQCSYSRSLGRAVLIGHHCDEQVGDAGPAHFAERSELLTIDTIEQQNAATEHLALVNWLEHPCSCRFFGIHHHFHIARLEFFHAASEYDAATIDEHHISENVLDLVHLMCGDHNGAAAIEVVVEQGIVELLAKQNVETKGWLVQHQQPRVNGHDQS